MPCNCDYMEPTKGEKNSTEVANHLVYVHGCLKKKCPSLYKAAATNLYGDVCNLNKMVVELCSLIRKMDKETQDKIIYDGKSKMARRLADWWDEHKAADRKRIAEERRQARLKRARATGLKKLTKIEREALLGE